MGDDESAARKSRRELADLVGNPLWIRECAGGCRSGSGFACNPRYFQSRAELAHLTCRADDKPAEAASNARISLDESAAFKVIWPDTCASGHSIVVTEQGVKANATCRLLESGGSASCVVAIGREARAHVPVGETSPGIYTEMMRQV